jgi:hypothetical protein
VGASLAILTRKTARAHRVPCSACFIRSRSGIANSLKNKGPRSRGADLVMIRYDYGEFSVAEYTSSSGLAGWLQSHGCKPGAPPPSSQIPNRSRVSDN